MTPVLIRVQCSRYVAVLTAAALLGWPIKALTATTEIFTPTTIHYPGSTSTTARGINNSEEIVGTYACATACVNPVTGETSAAGTHGFLLQDGIYARIDVPGGTSTIPRGISEQGAIIGQYNMAGVTHGFAYSDGQYVYPIDVPADLFDHPGSTLRHTLPIRISPQGDIVGCFHEDNISMTTMHGFLWRNGTFTVLSTPHSPGDTDSRDPDTMNNGIAPTGEVVGYYFTSGVSYIAVDNAIATTFTFDGNLFTLAYDVNPRGDIVGVYGVNPAVTVGSPVSPRGFLRTKDGAYRSLEVDGASSTQVFGINSIRDVVGQYTDVTGTHGFVYRVKSGNR